MTPTIKSRCKHFTDMERKIFLEILKKYKHVVECKKSNSASLREKDVAWTELCAEYNNSQLIMNERTVQQLKKLWTNMKQQQRDALTTERQNLIRTGGGPMTTPAKIDPDVATIAPDLLTTAPVLFSSNMKSQEIEDMNEKLRNVFPDQQAVWNPIEFVNNDLSSVDIIVDDDIVATEEPDHHVVDSVTQDVFAATATSTLGIDQLDESLAGTSKHSDTSLKELISPRKISSATQNKTTKRRKLSSSECHPNIEQELKIERLRRAFHQEKELANLKMETERKIAEIKIEHLLAMNALELRAATAIAEKEELLLAREQNKS